MQSLPTPSGGRGEMAMSPPCCARLFVRHRDFSQSLVHVACSSQMYSIHSMLKSIVSGAAGNNRREVAETPLLARTQGGNIGGARRKVLGRRESSQAELDPCGCSGVWSCAGGSAYLSQECKSLKKIRSCVPQLSRREYAELCRPSCGPAEYLSQGFDDLGQTVHVLVGSVNCGLGAKSGIGSRGWSTSTGAKERVEEHVADRLSKRFFGVQRRCSCASQRARSAWMLQNRHLCGPLRSQGRVCSS